MVVNDERVVLGRVRAAALASEPSLPVEQVMEPGPTTVRPDARLAEIVDRMQQKHTHSIVVTTSDGRLVGLVRRDELV